MKGLADKLVEDEGKTGAGDWEQYKLGHETRKQEEKKQRGEEITAQDKLDIIRLEESVELARKLNRNVVEPIDAAALVEQVMSKREKEVYKLLREPGMFGDNRMLSPQSGVRYNFNAALVQYRLRQLGYLGNDEKKLTIDGLFGPNSRHALSSFKKRNILFGNLETVDSLAASIMFSDVAIGSNEDKGYSDLHYLYYLIEQEVGSGAWSEAFEYRTNHIPLDTENDAIPVDENGIPLYTRRSGIKIELETITIHSTGNLTSYAIDERNWLINPYNTRTASFHIVVDERGAIEVIPLDERAIHAGSQKGNDTSIAIEITHSGDREQTLRNTAILTAKLLQERGWDTSHLRTHNDWSGKNCPRILIVLIACDTAVKILDKKESQVDNEYDKDIQMKDSKNNPVSLHVSSDMAIDSIFPDIEGFTWYYEGPNDSEKISMLDSIKVENNKRMLNMKSCREDLSGLRKLEDRISYETIEIRGNVIIKDGSIILKEPIVPGNAWDTQYSIKPSGKMHKATIEIVEIKDDTVKTRAIVNTEDNDIEEQYEELTIYKLGVGIVSQWYNIVGMGGYSRGLNLVKTYDQPVIPEKWYLPPYMLEREKN